ncbi:hypothetical protein JCM11251_003423 [Rhodosporidiobolus azoricus]
MLRRTTRACRCATTSRAPLCRHSHSPSSPNPSSSTPRSDDVRSLDYAAPLYQPGSRTKWFSALRLGWNGWRGRDGSPHTASTLPSSPSPSSSFLPDLSFGFRPPLPPTPLLEDQPLSQLSHYLTSRGPRAQLSSFEPEEYDALLRTAERGDMPLLGAMVKEDQQLRQLGARQRRHLEMERLELGKRVVEGRGLGEDVRLAVPRVAEEKEKRAPERREGKEREVVETVKALEAEVAKAVEAETTKQDDILLEKVSTEVVESAEAIPPTADSAVLDPVVARNFMSTLSATPSSGDLVLPHSLSHAFPRLKKADQLSLVWDTFAASADLGNSPSDLRLALNSIHRLSAPASASAAPPPATHLSLSLRILDSLLSFLPESVLAAEPRVSPSLAQTARVQAVLLRTLSNIALTEADHASSPLDAQAFLIVSARAVLSYDVLRSCYLDALRLQTSDRTRLRSTTSALLTSLSTERVFTYRPSTLPSAAASPDTALSLTGALLPLYLANSPGERETVLDFFAVEVATRYRWDLLARVWDENNTRGGMVDRREGWVLKRDHLKLARWLAGEAPVGMYPSLAAEVEAGAEPVRPVDTYLFNRLATQTYRFFRTSEDAPRWTLTDKNAYLLLLTSSPASTPHTRSIARRLATHWLGIKDDPFLLSAPALLSLLRTSLRPHTRTSHSLLREKFAKPLILTHIRSLISPSSPFARPTTVAQGKLDHFDLTTLAQAYAIVGDWDSMGEVNGQILRQKIVPDQRDVEVIVAAGPGITEARRKSAAGRVVDGNPARLAELALQMGVTLKDERVWLALVRGVLEGELGLRQFSDRVRTGKGEKVMSWDGEEDRKKRLGKKVERVIEEARKAGVEDRGLHRMRKYAQGFVPLRDATNSLPATSSVDSSSTPTLLRSKLRHLLSVDPTSTSRSASFPSPSLDLFRSNLALADDQSFSLLLRCALKSWDAARRGNRAMQEKERSKVIGGVRELGHMICRSEAEVVRGTVRTSETLDLLLRVLVKADDVAFLDRVTARLTSPSLPSASDEVLSIVVRRAVEQEGRQKLLSRKGWLGDKAREVLMTKEKRVEKRRKKWVGQQVRRAREENEERTVTEEAAQ